MVSKKELYNISKSIRREVETKYKLPVSVDGVKVTDATYLMSCFVVKQENDIKKVSVKGASGPTGERINRSVNKKNYTDMARRVKEYIEKNKQNPNYVSILGEQKCSIVLFIYCLSKIIVYYNEHNNTLPNYCVFDSSIFNKQNTTTSSTSNNSVYDYFIKIFGRITCIDDALEKIQGKGYGYYYDDKYSNKESIDRIRNGKGVNCTDSCQVFKHVAEATGRYKKVDVIHVKCRGGDGHVRLRLQLKDSTYIYRDPAAVLNGSAITHNWCSDGTLLAVNPAWFNMNLNR